MSQAQLQQYINTMAGSNVGFLKQFSMLLDDNDEYIRIPNNAQINLDHNQAWTLTARVKRTSNNDDVIMSRRNTGVTQAFFEMRVQPSGGGFSDRLVLQIRDSSGAQITFNSTSTIVPGSGWHLAAATCNGAGLYEVLLDDISGGTINNVFANTITSNNDLDIGQFDAGGGNWGGNIGTIGIFNKVLTTGVSSEMEELLNGGADGDITAHSAAGNLLSAYAMGGGAVFGGGVWTFPDISAFNTNALSVNMELADRVIDVAA